MTTDLPDDPKAYHRDPTKHPAHVDRATLRPIKRSGFVRIRFAGARLKSCTAIHVVQHANTPHAYTNKLCNDILVPLWAALVFACLKGSRKEALTTVMRDVQQQPADWRDAFTAAYRLSGLDAAKAVLNARGWRIPQVG